VNDFPVRNAIRQHQRCGVLQPAATPQEYEPTVTEPQRGGVNGFRFRNQIDYFAALVLSLKLDDFLWRCHRLNYTRTVGAKAFQSS